MPHDAIGKKVYKYALKISDEASSFKEAELLTSKKGSPLTWPKILKVNPGKEFMASVNVLMSKKGVTLQRSEVGNHRAQGIVERLNKTLAERLFSHQYAQEMTNKDSQSREWVKKLPLVIKALNDQETRLIGLKPKDAIKMKSVQQNPAAPAHRLVEKRKRKIAGNALVRYLYAPGEAERDTGRTDRDSPLNFYN